MKTKDDQRPKKKVAISTNMVNLIQHIMMSTVTIGPMIKADVMMTAHAHVNFLAMNTRKVIGTLMRTNMMVLTIPNDYSTDCWEKAHHHLIMLKIIMMTKNSSFLFTEFSVCQGSEKNLQLLSLLLMFSQYLHLQRVRI